MINPHYDLDLKWTGLVVGLALLVAHVFALLQPRTVQGVLQKFPRNHTAGGALMLLNAVWAFWLVSTMDLGEFYTLRNKLQWGIPIATVLVILYVEDFLAVRALGTTMLLGACILLDTAWFEDGPGVVLLPLLAYAWILVAFFWVGMPYLLRDLLQWISSSKGRWRALCLAGAACGALLFGCALFFY
ncbi:MAG TPA: hypothetical protein VMN36_08150 [Verrucomicrobiales bacterium]|nr:hypothetical protein [Verrucomicrobiales bacterium]